MNDWLDHVHLRNRIKMDEFCRNCRSKLLHVKVYRFINEMTLAFCSAKCGERFGKKSHKTLMQLSKEITSALQDIIFKEGFDAAVDKCVEILSRTIKETSHT